MILRATACRLISRLTVALRLTVAAFLCLLAALLCPSSAEAASQLPLSVLCPLSTKADTTLPQVEPIALPRVPATLRTPRERAGYVVEHFWDALAFSDTLRSCNRDLIEQHFADYASLFPHADTTAVAGAVERLMQRAEEVPAAWRTLAEVAEKYLYEPQSPLFNEQYYSLFLHRFVRAELLESHERLHYRYQLTGLEQNRPGSVAADFRYTDAAGRRQSLHKTEAARLLLIFYDPDCDHCRETMLELAQNASVSRAVATGELRVLAIYADGDATLWKPAEGIPATWTTGLDRTGIQQRGLYHFVNLPALYLLDTKKVVLLKHPTVEQLAGYFE